MLQIPVNLSIIIPHFSEGNNTPPAKLNCCMAQIIS